MKEEIYIRVGGAAGQGGASTGETIAKNFARHGLNVCTQTSYQSAIRGGHNWIEIRASDKTFYSQGWNCQGLEPRSFIKAPGIKRKINQINGKVDIIVAFDVLEHVADPLKYLKLLNTKLKIIS